MTVYELIQKLSKSDPNTKVLIEVRPPKGYDETAELGIRGVEVHDDLVVLTVKLPGERLRTWTTQDFGTDDVAV